MITVVEPKPVKQDGTWALEQAKAGKYVRRTAWDSGVYMYISNTGKCVLTRDGSIRDVWTQEEFTTRYSELIFEIYVKPAG